MREMDGLKQWDYLLGYQEHMKQTYKYFPLTVMIRIGTLMRLIISWPTMWSPFIKDQRLNNQPAKQQWLQCEI